MSDVTTVLFGLPGVAVRDMRVDSHARSKLKSLQTCRRLLAQRLSLMVTLVLSLMIIAEKAVAYSPFE